MLNQKLSCDQHRQAPIRSILSVAMLLIAALPLTAQAPVAVRVPSQLATAKTVFLASGSAPTSGSNQSVIAQMVYSSVYTSLSAAGRYHLVSTPAEAELSMIISIQSYNSSVAFDSSTEYSFLRLEIYDVKTHTLLWALNEPIDIDFPNKKGLQKKVGQSVAALMVDLNGLASGAIPGK